MKLSEHFDAVLMLTWSDWKIEPRSNRYHYATRFAKTLPVFFLQHRYQKVSSIQVEPSGLDNIDLVHVSCGISPAQVQEIKELLTARGIKCPLVWVYDPIYYQLLIVALPRAFRVYHATEDYLTRSNGWNGNMSYTEKPLKSLLQQIDFMVACSSAVGKSYIDNGGYLGAYAIIDNGCDADWYLNLFTGRQFLPEKNRKPVMIFQGGINNRLDYALLLELSQRLPDWELRFCGIAQPSRGWQAILGQNNVNYLGKLPAEEVAKQMLLATVGIIPFIQDQWIRNSFPLKAYEYVACGLPVVSVPITSLEREPDMFTFASTTEEFEQAIRAAVLQRSDPKLLKKRKAAAQENSYDSRFALMEKQLLKAKVAAQSCAKKFCIVILYDNVASLQVNTIAEHLEAFEKYSKHSITYIPATTNFWRQSPEHVANMLDMSIFDVAIVHYSVRLSTSDHLDQGVACSLHRFSGLKVLFIQDEYEGTEIARNWMERIHFDVVYTCVPAESIEMVYPAYRFPATEFLPTLTGYVPENPCIKDYAKPLSQRPIAIGYRGRDLHPVYGELGHEKWRIGVEMKRLAQTHGILVDIEVDDSRRIYGDAWYEFLGSCRATLGTESGANVFDFDNSLRKKIDLLKKLEPEISFKDISEQVLQGHEGLIHMNQISPKIFEAIQLRTALILFEGEYLGVVGADKHFIPLKKDFSNIDEVLTKVADDEFLAALTERAYQDVIASQRYCYRTFVEGIDHDIGTRIYHSVGEKLFMATFKLTSDGQLVPALPLLPDGLWSGNHPLGAPQAALVSTGSTIIQQARFALWGDGGVMRGIWRLLPQPLRNRLVPHLHPLISFSTRIGYRVARRVWRHLPSGIQGHIRRVIQH